MKILTTMLTLSVATFGLVGCMNMDGYDSRPAGEYNRSSHSVDQNGTSRDEETSTDVYYDKYGNKKVTVDKKVTTDPKGLFNKRTSQSRETTK